MLSSLTVANRSFKNISLLSLLGIFLFIALNLAVFSAEASTTAAIAYESLSPQESDEEQNDDQSDELKLKQQRKEKKQTSKNLDNVQSAIKKQKRTISKTNKKRRRLEAQLKTDDLAISTIARAINQTNQEQKAVEKKLNELNIEKKQLAREKQRQESLLAQQLRTAYSTGNHDYLKLVLNQKAPGDVQRAITYYQYLNDARVKEIISFQTTLSALLQITTEHQEQAEKLKTIQQQQSEQKVALQDNKTIRSKTIKALSKELLSNRQQLVNLESEEDNLVAALQELSRLTSPSSSNLSGISKLKRKLSWPIKGKIAHRFGTQKQGYLKWKGVLMSAPVGRAVQTIHHGTVLFADWLKGYGLVTVVDHGDGYMSLYGHNQTLLKAVGDRVETGESIALVGQSGGQQQAGLYFEIRHRGRAVNPKLWCK
jgi:septal ring factor EnvC (AmiA/AmiB activator)